MHGWVGLGSTTPSLGPPPLREAKECIIKPSGAFLPSGGRQVRQNIIDRQLPDGKTADIFPYDEITKQRILHGEGDVDGNDYCIWRWWWYADDMTILFLQSEWGRTIPEEAYWHGRVKHPAIIKLLDCYPPSDEYFVMIMEKPANSIDLQGLIQRHGPLGEVQGRQIFSQVSRTSMYGLPVYIRDKKWTGAQCGCAARTVVCWLFNGPHIA